MSRLAPDDWKLSMRLSPRARNPEYNDGLRSLLIHRLSDTMKLTGRRALRREERVAWFCEPCDRWVTREDDLTNGLPTKVVCPDCERHYRLELAVYEEIDPPEEGHEK